MRYQSAVASIRQMSFAFQFLRIFSFIFFVEEELAQPAAKLLDAQAALDQAAVADRDLPGFFGDNNSNGV